MFFTKKTTTGEIVRSMFVPALLGLVAGLAGALIVESYFAGLSATAVEPLQIGRLPTAVNGALSQTEIAERLHRLNAPVYPRLAAGSELPQRARGVSEAVGFATVLTSDGWLVTAPSVAAGQVSVAVGGRLLEPKTRIADPRTGLVFLKVDATALPVSGFEETEGLRPGTPLYAFDEGGMFVATAFAGTTPVNRRSQALHLENSDLFVRAFHLDGAWGSRSAGSAVLSADGDLAGFVVPEKAGSDTFVPMHLVSAALTQIFRGDVPVRATLGVQTLPLDVTAYADGGFGGVNGARITGSRALGLPAVRPGSSAAKAGLQEGDIILRVDGTDLTDGRNLSELIATLEPGAKIRFDVLKDGAERPVDVTLDGEKR
ncbi:MAG: S1C family serine protease [Patescibacteria group bacterium]|nr:MAG: S1C family serine protease [Patescibacteria group bacterium]